MVYTRKIAIPPLTGDKQRRLYIYLPDSYEGKPDNRYPVLYMFDGHNVFFDSDATYGKSWGMKEYMEQTGTELIIVAPECNHEGNGRLSEYSPFNFSNKTIGTIRGLGSIYMDWLIHSLKPDIDKEFRTLPDREHTFIAGSSMGGLMSLYAVSAFNDVFSRAACLSPSLWVSGNKIMSMLTNAAFAPETRIYIDYGSEELANHAASGRALTRVVDYLFNRGVYLTFRVVPGGTHCEASWEKQIPIFTKCLGF